MAETVYSLCALTSLTCALLLLRKYFRTGARILIWSGLCFLLWAVNNVILFVDLMVGPTYDFSVWRAMTGLAAMFVLLFGFVWEVS